MAIFYKKFNEKFLEGVMELEKAWVIEDITYGIVESGKDYFLNVDKNYFFVAIDKAKIIGYIISEIIYKNEYNIFPKDVKFIRVNDLYVLKEYRSKGIGKKLLYTTETEAQNNGINHILLSTATKDTDTIIKFYERNGYKIWTTSLFKNIE